MKCIYFCLLYISFMFFFIDCGHSESLSKIESTNNWKIVRFIKSNTSPIEQSVQIIEHSKQNDYDISIKDPDLISFCEFSCPIIYNDNYIAIKTYRLRSKETNSSAIVILNDGFIEIETLYSEDNKRFSCLAISPDKSKLVFSTDTHEGFLLDLKSKELVSLNVLSVLPFERNAFHPGNNIICYTKRHSQEKKSKDSIFIYDIKQQREKYICDGENASFVNENIICYIKNSKFYYYNLKTQKNKKIFSYYLDDINKYFLSPGGKYVLFRVNCLGFLRECFDFRLIDIETKQNIEWDHKYIADSEFDWVLLN